MEQRTLKNVNNYLNTNIYSYLETSGVQSYDLYLNVVHFSTPVLIRHLWQLKTVVFLHWFLILALLLLVNDQKFISRTDKFICLTLFIIINNLYFLSMIGNRSIKCMGVEIPILSQI
jgi:hypothetical protein